MTDQILGFIRIKNNSNQSILHDSLIIDVTGMYLTVHDLCRKFYPRKKVNNRNGCIVVSNCC